MTVIWWRDIPAQITAKEGRRQSKIVLQGLLTRVPAAGKRAIAVAAAQRS